MSCVRGGVLKSVVVRRGLVIMKTAASWIAAGLTKLTRAGRSASPDPKTDWLHLPPESRAARTRLAKLFFWCASAEDAHLNDTEFVEAAIKRYQEFVQRPLIDPNE